MPLVIAVPERVLEGGDLSTTAGRSATFVCKGALRGEEPLYLKGKRRPRSRRLGHLGPSFERLSCAAPTLASAFGPCRRPSLRPRPRALSRAGAPAMLSSHAFADDQGDMRGGMGAVGGMGAGAEQSTGLVSGGRCLSQAALDARVRRVAAGLAALGVARGACVAILMRNDIAFIEAAYAAQTLGAYAVPINWHFKAEEIVYILADCGTSVLIGHADLIQPVAADIPPHITLI